VVPKVLDVLHFCPIGTRRRNLQRFYKILPGPYFPQMKAIFFILTSTKTYKLKTTQKMIPTANGLTSMTVWVTVILIPINILYYVLICRYSNPKRFLFCLTTKTLHARFSSWYFYITLNKQ
jgi:hypothetical protein